MNLYRLMDLKIDYAFKQLFGNEQNKRITITFLNAILKRTENNYICDLEFKNTEYEGEYADDKLSRLDILALTDSQEQINIEIQFSNRYDMVKRSLYYWSRIYKEQLKRSETYIELRPTIMINILNFNQFRRETTKFHTTFRLYEQEEQFQLTDVIELHFIEMRKLLVHWKQNKLNPWDNILARWLLLLGAVDKQAGKVYEDIYQELEAIAMKDDVLKEAFDVWELLSADENKRLQYESRLKVALDEYAAKREAEIRLKMAEEEGLKRGMEKGMEKGMEIGIEKGIEKSRIEVAKNLLQEGLRFDVIMKATGLTREELERLRIEK